MVARGAACARSWNPGFLKTTDRAAWPSTWRPIFSCLRLKMYKTYCTDVTCCRLDGMSTDSVASDLHSNSRANPTDFMSYYPGKQT
jgi:hypothetical protein